MIPVEGLYKPDETPGTDVHIGGEGEDEIPDPTTIKELIDIANEKLKDNNYENRGFYKGQQQYSDEEYEPVIQDYLFKIKNDGIDVSEGIALMEYIIKESGKNLTCIGEGTFGYVFLIENTNLIIKIFKPSTTNNTKE